MAARAPRSASAQARRAGFCLAIACAGAASCAKSSSIGDLDPLDLAPSEVPFDKNLIVDTASFTDSEGVASVADIQGFLEKTPYGHPSFLASYVSGGLRASQSIALAARRYGLNPLVFLVRAEMDAGLVSAAGYPASPAKVEYVFGCGCPGGGAACEPAQGGFGKQVDCLGSALRASLQLVCGTSAQTAGGWAVGQDALSLDGVHVSPASEATAALYQYAPVVAQGAPGGNWLFFNVWQLYGAQLSYFGSATSPWVGDSCCGDGMCAGVASGTCAVNAPGGLCTATCSAQRPCPTDPEGGGRRAVCGNLGGEGFCLRGCNPGACRSGYKCVQIAPVGGGAAALACLPQ